MPTSRREFLKLCAAVGTAAVATVAVSQLTMSRSETKGSSQDEIHPQWVMMIDIARCQGCEDISHCLTSCALSHYIPKLDSSSGGKEDAPQPWIELFELEDNPSSGSYNLPRPCMHCESPPCLYVCPTGATFKSEEGLVLIDHRICIGCRMCMAACPYNARSFNWGEPEPWSPDGTVTREDELLRFPVENYSPEFPLPHQKGVVEKCDLCGHLGNTGTLPACVNGCPNGAIYFGDLNQDTVTNSQHQTVKLSSTLEARMAFRLHEELGTKPRVYYLPR